MNAFRNGMGFLERQIAVNLKFQFDICFSTKHPGMEHIYPHNIFLRGDIRNH